MKFITLSVMSLLLTSQVFAANCFNQVNTAFLKQNPQHHVHSVKRMGQLAAGADMPIGMGEVWNSSQNTVDVYYVESGFMAKFGHAVLVAPKTCNVEKIIEVFFE